MDVLVKEWLDDPDIARRLAHVEVVAGRQAGYRALDLAEPVQELLAEAGIHQLYEHQVEAIESVREGRHTVVVAGTASGKSLVYQVPIAEAIAHDPKSTAIAIYPTKALAQDQLRGFSGYGKRVVAATYDGDTDRDQRTWVRKHANVLLTNPDMLHIGILPNHGRWADFFHRLQFVVVDEMHMLRGVFGTHVAMTLRRLRRIANHYGSDPTFVFTSATIGNPADLGAALIGAPVAVVDRDTSPTGRKQWVLWNPPLDEDDLDSGERGSPIVESAQVMTRLVDGGYPTIVFARSRKSTELIYARVRDALPSSLANRVAPYRGGYKASDRRETERRLFSGELIGVVTTNALELGIDIGGLEAAVLTTYPGTIASLRQQAGRAGRSQEESIAVLVGGSDALDQYFMHHPKELFTRAPEAGVINPTNPLILDGHLTCAAFELPLNPEDRTFFGPDVEEAGARLVSEGRLRMGATGLIWGRGGSPASTIGLRSAGGPPVSIVDGGELLGTVGRTQAMNQVHPGAVYLHQGSSYLVNRLDLDRSEARVSRQDLNYYTEPKEDKWIEVLDEVARIKLGRIGLAHGRVRVESQITGYKRKSRRGGDNLGMEYLDLPPQTYETQAFWFTVPDRLFEASGVGPREIPGTLHAAEHAAIGMMPLFAICDRWDIGGLSTPFHPDLEMGAGWFIYDGHPGGAGIAPIGYERAAELLAATLRAIADCPCADGCPSCVQSPKCGNFNDPLDKAGALALLSQLG
jgi:DEAD/DEAH box helicase domain-containing protein